MTTKNHEPTNSEIIIYQTEDGKTNIQCHFEDETIWLTQTLMAELFQKDVRTINEHLSNIFDEGELKRDATIRKFRIVQKEGNRQVSREIEHYNLDVIIAVGFRVRSHRGTQFRQWAISHLNEYLVKGFTIDDERLKKPANKNQIDYFDELLERIRSIRASERRFYQKILDIYSTSIDYTANSTISQKFFTTVQNKMHFAVHGKTAAEVIYERADANKPLMGLTSTRHKGIVHKDEVSIAKNYLNEDELKTLNLIINFYLEFAELRAIERKPMTMQNWVNKLDEFLKISDRELLTHAGKISAEIAKQKAESEYENYRIWLDKQPNAVDKDFENMIKLVDEQKKIHKNKKTSQQPL